MPKLGRKSEPPIWEDMGLDKWSTMNAPFGTSDQPPVRVRIVGGKRVLVSDDRKFVSPHLDQPTTPRTPAGKVRPPYGRSHQLTSRSSALPWLGSLTEKPNNFDPTTFVNHSRHHSSPGKISLERANLDAQSLKITSPDRDGAHLTLNPHKVIPPIPTENRRQSPRKERDEIRLNISDRNTHNVEDNNSFNKDLSHLLLDDEDLPKEPLVLSKDQEWELRQQISKDFEGFDPKKLQNIYLELAGFDHKLTGFVRFQDLSYCLLRLQANMTVLHLRLVASLFLSREVPGKVNYEKVLSFIAASIKSSAIEKVSPMEISSQEVSSPGREASPRKDQPKEWLSYNPITHQEGNSPDDQRRSFPYGDGNNAKLLRMIEDQLLAAEDPLIWEKIWASFQAADRQHRGKLSRPQIIELSNICRIPLQASIVNNIIDRCDSSNGQYNWEQYLGYIERVQPQKTGLFIPDSKRPLEFAKQYPTPSDNWPANSKDPLTPRGKYPPSRQQQTQASMIDSNHDPLQKVIENSPLNEVQRSLDKQEAIIQIEREIQQLETERMKAEQNLKAEKPSKTANSEPWFERFMKMANAMYSNDASHTGYLSKEEVQWLSKEYNTVYNLGIGQPVIEQAITTCSDRRGVRLDTLLRILGAQEP